MGTMASRDSPVPPPLVVEDMSIVSNVSVTTKFMSSVPYDAKIQNVMEIFTKFLEGRNNVDAIMTLKAMQNNSQVKGGTPFVPIFKHLFE